MEITTNNKGILEINNARLVYRNFQGRGDKFNREGDRNFSVVIPNQEIADQLLAAGWNLKIKASRDDQELPFITLPVKIKFNDRGPACYLVANGNVTRLSEDMVGIIDDIDIESVDLDVRPYDWEINGKSGRTAYLQGISVTQKVDRFAERFARANNPDTPFGDSPILKPIPTI